MEPAEYCQVWVPRFYGKQPGEWGYKAACIRELARVAEISEASIERNWGSEFERAPDYVKRLLAFADIANRVMVSFPPPPGFDREN